MLISRNYLHITFQTEDGALTSRAVPHRWWRVFAPSPRETHPWLYPATARTDKYIDAAHSSKMKRETCGGLQLNPVTGMRREATTICNDYSVCKPTGYYKLFCAHDKAYWCVCGMCRRDNKEAIANWARLQAGTL